MLRLRERGAADVAQLRALLGGARPASESAPGNGSKGRQAAARAPAGERGGNSCLDALLGVRSLSPTSYSRRER